MYLPVCSNLIYIYFPRYIRHTIKSEKYCTFRFATSKYKEPTGQNISNMFMHLTNYSVNKHSRMYVIDDEIGSKRFVYSNL